MFAIIRFSHRPTAIQLKHLYISYGTSNPTTVGMTTDVLVLLLKGTTSLIVESIQRYVIYDDLSELLHFLNIKHNSNDDVVSYQMSTVFEERFANGL